MCKVLLFAANTPIQTIQQKIKMSKRRPRLQSVLRKAFQFSKDNGTFTPPKKPYKQKTPPWFFSKDTVNLSLHHTTKAITPPTIYQKNLYLSRKTSITTDLSTRRFQICPRSILKHHDRNNCN